MNRIVETARKYVGQAEKPGKNAGFKDAAFETAMRAVGWQTGWAWCVCFCKLVWFEAFAGNEALLKRVGELLVPMATAAYARFSKATDFQVSRTPVPGAIAIWKHGIGPQGHAGIVVEVLQDGDFVTIEGNTNAGGGREGDQVARKVRQLNFTVREGRLNLVGFILPPEVQKS